MPLKARIRGFGPLVPEDLQVTFYDDLPPDALCAQCDNVSAQLLRDPGGHGYCPSCTKMCTFGSRFQCSVCDKYYRASELIKDESTPMRISQKRIFCPGATGGKDVRIPFESLKEHLNYCRCGSVATSAEDFVHPCYLQVTVCSYCGRKMSKKEISDHIKICKEKPKELRQRDQNQSLPPKAEDQADAKKKAQDTPVSFDQARLQAFFEGRPLRTQVEPEREGGMFPKRNFSSFDSSSRAPEPEEHVANTWTEIHRLKAEIANIYELWSRSQSKIYAQEEKISDLEKALHKKDNAIQELTEKVQSYEDDIAKMREALSQKDDTDLLTETVRSHQVDLKNVQIQCDKAEQLVADLKRLYDSQQETMSSTSEKSSLQIHKIKEAIKNMGDCYSASFNGIQAEQGHLRHLMTQCFSELQQLKTSFDVLRTSHYSLFHHLFSPQQGHLQNYHQAPGPK